MLPKVPQFSGLIWEKLNFWSKIFKPWKNYIVLWVWEIFSFEFCFFPFQDFLWSLEELQPIILAGNWLTYLTKVISHFRKWPNTQTSPSNSDCTYLKILPDFRVQSQDISDIKILQFLHDTYLPEDGQVLVSPCDQNISQGSIKKWDIVTHANMTGSERDWVIVFADDNFGNLEVMSRARERLIIIRLHRNAQKLEMSCSHSKKWCKNFNFLGKHQNLGTKLIPWGACNSI